MECDDVGIQDLIKVFIKVFHCSEFDHRFLDTNLLKWKNEYEIFPYNEYENEFHSKWNSRKIYKQCHVSKTSYFSTEEASFLVYAKLFYRCVATNICS